jgi:hypothetical protein
MKRFHWEQIKRFFSNPHKPIILALARPDPKKNLTKLVKAFGECRPLKELANLVTLFMTSFSFSPSLILTCSSSF